MKTKLIKTIDYLLLIDEEAEIKENDYLYDKLTSHYAGIHQHSGVEYENDNATNIIQCKSGTTAPISCSSKMIAYYPLSSEAKELDLPLLPNPFEGVDVEKEFNSQYKNFVFDDAWEETLIKSAFREGYKAAQSQSKQFSLEDIKKAFLTGQESCSNSDTPLDVERYIQSLSTQQLPKEFIPETEVDPTNPKNWYEDRPSGKYWEDEPVPPSPNNLYTNGTRRLKTITNSEGKEELVGTYKYE